MAMNRTCKRILIALSVLLAHATAFYARADDIPKTSALKGAIDKTLPLIQASAKEYPSQRDCFSCHHQAVPVLAMTLAKSRGFTVDDEVIQAQLKLTETDLRGSIDSYKKGNGQGGGVTRAGYALWTLALGGRKPDDVTDAVAGFLLDRDKKQGYWRSSSRRPPSEFSPFTSTYVALRGLEAYSRPEQKEKHDERIDLARKWLLANPGGETEERAFRLWGLKLAGADEADIQVAAKALRETQREDGSWSQLDGKEGDAYATGTALVALNMTGGLKRDDPSYRRGLAYLIKTQGDDGSWRVVSRSRPFQIYFESGFPHGKDQFISMAATSWATAALLLGCDPPSP